MSPSIEVKNLSKVYAGGFQALKDVSLEIQKGEIFALLGPNGAGKTTLIGIICGILNKSEGSVSVEGHDNVEDYRITRRLIGLVPQELTTDAFESVWNTVSYSRGLFGLPSNPKYIEKVLKELSLWDKKNSELRTLSGGMKRRVMIAKALSHEPKVLFLDEPSAGVDVELRQDMWMMVRQLRESGVTIILTTHYIEEAEDMADRIGVINHGELIMVDNKKDLMKKLGSKVLAIDLKQPVQSIPNELSSYNLKIEAEGYRVSYTYDTAMEETRIAELLEKMTSAGFQCKDLQTKQSSLEDIFVNLVRHS